MKALKYLQGVSMQLQWHRSKVHALQAPLTKPKASKIASPAKDTQLRQPANSASPSKESKVGPSNPQPTKLKRLRRAKEVWGEKGSLEAILLSFCKYLTSKK